MVLGYKPWHLVKAVLCFAALCFASPSLLLETHQWILGGVKNDKKCSKGQRAVPSVPVIPVLMLILGNQSIQKKVFWNFSDTSIGDPDYQWEEVDKTTFSLIIKVVWRAPWHHVFVRVVHVLIILFMTTFHFWEFWSSAPSKTLYFWMVTVLNCWFSSPKLKFLVSFGGCV